MTGQNLLERIERYIGRYVALPSDPAGQSLVLALWALHTWLYEHYPATPYLTITAGTKGAGKTLCMEVLSLICRGAHVMATLRPLAMLRVIDVHDGKCTIGVDESEKLTSSAVGDLRSIFTTGYTAGGEHYITTKTREYLRFRTFCPKMFALIGDVMDVVRDRAIVVHLRRATPAEDFRATLPTAASEAQAIVAGILGYFRTIPPLVQPMFLQGREREIWSPIFSIAAALNLDKATMNRLTSACADMVGLKSAEARSYFRAEESEVEASARMAGERAIQDLREVLRDGEQAIFSAVAVERMRALPTGPWRTFRGRGLDEVTLAGLLNRFGLQTKIVRMHVGKGARRAKQLNGYRVSDVHAAIERMG